MTGKVFFEHYQSVVSLYQILSSRLLFEDFILIDPFKYFSRPIFILIILSLVRMIDLLFGYQRQISIDGFLVLEEAYNLYFLLAVVNSDFVEVEEFLVAHSYSLQFSFDYSQIVNPQGCGQQLEEINLNYDKIYILRPFVLHMQIKLFLFSYSITLFGLLRSEFVFLFICLRQLFFFLKIISISHH